MFEDLRKKPLMIILTCALLVIIIIAVFTPRKNRLTAGLNLGGHIGSLILKHLLMILNHPLFYFMLLGVVIVKK